MSSHVSHQESRPLRGRVALVAGATRGAGRGIASMLGEAGATVYCSGRSSRDKPSATARRPETIEDTAERVSALGGRGIAVRTDHSVETEVIALCERIRAEAGRLDILVNDIWGCESLIEFGKPFWQRDPLAMRTMFERGVLTHVITSRHMVPFMLESDRPGLIVEVTDGNSFGYRGMCDYDVIKMSVIRLAWNMSRDLKHTKLTALAITPGFLRSEEMLDHFGVSEANWRDATAKEPHFIASETPSFVGRAVAALAADPGVAAKSGKVWSSWDLSREYGFKDIDGSSPHWGDYFAGAFGRPWPAVSDEAYASWRNGPGELEPPAAD